MATHLTTTGDEHDLGFNPDLKTLQAAVEGYIEGVPLVPETGYVLMYCNEDGLRKRLAPNPFASTMALRPIVGDVVLLTQAEVDADS
jgi:hypothetical protein